MSKLYLSAVNERGSKSTKCAHSHISAHVSTWENGIMVNAEIRNGITYFDIYKTNGSNGSEKTKIYSFESKEYSNE